MARVVMAVYAWGGRKTEYGYQFPPFYEGFINELQQNGNEVLVYANADTFGYQFEEDIPNNILSELKEFNPDLFIFFSNKFWDVSEHFDCPIIVYGDDSPVIYSNKKALAKKRNRYLYIVSQQTDIQEVVDYFKVDKTQIAYMPFVTSIMNRKTKKNKNIVFCGSVWLWDGCQEVVSYMKTSPNTKDAIFNQKYSQMLIKYPLIDQDTLYQKTIKELGYKSDKKLDIKNREIYVGRWSGVNRMKYLQSIADLGLEIYGNHWAQNSMAYFPDLALCWNSQSIAGISEWENLLNHSHIGFNVSHLQAKDGFSWRVVDTMGSGACLVTNYSPALDRLFKKNKIPSYTSQYEARELCQKILKNPNMEKDIVAYCNEKINQGFRHKHLLKNIEDFIGVPLTNISQSIKENKTIMLQVRNQALQSKPKSEISTKEQKNWIFKDKIQYKIWKHLNKYFNKTIDQGYIKSSFSNKIRYKIMKYLSKKLVKKNIILSQNNFEDKVRYAIKNKSSIFCEPLDNLLKKQGLLSNNILSILKSNTIPKELMWKYLPIAKDNTVESIIKCASYQSLNQIILRQLREKLKIQKKVRVAFYVQKIFQYESLFREMEKDPLFEPFIVVIPDKFRHLNTSTDETIEIYKEYKETYDSVYLGYDFNQNKPIDFIDKIDILFFSIPYSGMHYPEHFIWHALTNRVLTCFQNYGYFTTKWGRTNIAITGFFNCCWKIFTDSVETFHDLQVYQPLHAQNAVITGYCKMDGLAQYQQKVPNKRKTILICPHHTVWDFNGICLSNFLQYAEFFLELPKKFPQVDFIFRPHPLLFYNLVYSKKIWTEEQKNEYLKKMTSYRNVTFDDNISFFESFAKSDACIHDCGSFTAEYLYTENPCCYMLKNKAEIDEQFLPIGKECLEVYYQAYSQTEIEKFIQSVVIEENDPLKDKRKILAKKIKVNYPNVGKYILNYLKKELFS